MLKLAILVFMLSLSGCASLAPENKSSDIKLPKQFATTLSPGEEFQVNTTPWWSLFEDPALVALVNHSRAENIDIRSAVAQVEFARTLYSEIRQGYFPRGSIVADMHEFRKSAMETGKESTRGDQNQAGVNIQWEIDLFGRIRNANRATLARMQAEEAILEQIRHSVTADVVRTYFALRAAQDRLAVRVAYRQTQAEIVALIQEQVTSGMGKPEDLERARAELHENESNEVTARAQQEALQFVLAVLLNDVPGEFKLAEADPLPSLQW